MNQNTLIDELSSTLYKGLSFLETPEFQEATQNFNTLVDRVTSLEQEVTSSLSAIYTVHPFDRMKEEYFGTDYKFKSIDDLEEPDHLDCEECAEYFKLKSKELASTSVHNLTCCEEEKITTAFSFMSGDHLVSDCTKQKNYIEFIEMARNIPIDSINEDNYVAIGKKLVSQLMKAI
jgi:hypothetical protein